MLSDPHNKLAKAWKLVHEDAAGALGNERLYRFSAFVSNGEVKWFQAQEGKDASVTFADAFLQQIENADFKRQKVE